MTGWLLKLYLLLALVRFALPAFDNLYTAVQRDPTDRVVRHAQRWLRTDWYRPQRRAILVLLALLDLPVLIMIAVLVFS